MIKSDLVRRVWEQNPHLLIREVETIVNAIFDEITARLSRGERIELRGFGTFSVRVREAPPAAIPRAALRSPFQGKSFLIFGRERR
jgi:integration host factor subunit beta